MAFSGRRNHGLARQRRPGRARMRLSLQLSWAMLPAALEDPGAFLVVGQEGTPSPPPAEGVNHEDASVQVAAGPNPPNFFRHPCPLKPGGNQPPRYGVGQPSLAPHYLFGSESLLSSCLARPRLLQAFHSERFCSCAEPPSGQSPSAPGSFHSTLPVWSLAGC